MDDRQIAIAAVRRLANGRPWASNDEGVTIDGVAVPVAQIEAAIAAERAEALRNDIRAEFDRRIAAALGGDRKRGSLNSYGVKLNGLVSIGLSKGQTIEQALTAEQLADVRLLWAIDDWETQMIAAREALIDLADPGYADDTHWPAPPAGVTAEWLAGF